MVKHPNQWLKINRELDSVSQTPVTSAISCTEKFGFRFLEAFLLTAGASTASSSIPFLFYQIVVFVCLFCIQLTKTTGSFGIDDGNGSENVSFKMNSHFFSLCRVYHNLLKMASVAEFPWR